MIDFWQLPWVLQLLQLPVTGQGPELVTYAVAVVAAVALSLRGHRDRDLWRLGVMIGAVAGVLGGMIAVLVLDVWLRQVPMGLPRGGRVWVVVASGIVGLAVLNLALAPWWRKAVAVLVMVPVVAAAAVGINASWAILHNVGQLVGKPAAEVVDVGDLPPGGAATAGPAWLASEWHPPADMPEQGRRITLTIPPTTSGFQARPASIYLPPAALVAHPPPLPVVVLMMGQPGVPDVTYVADALDDKVPGRSGLAPIVVVADQTGTPWNDTLCMDTTAYGQVETYINTDVVAFIRGHLRVSSDRSDWVVAGYSNGGLCAGRFLARHPDVWGNALDISGEEYPGSDNSRRTLTEFFGGDKARYERERLTSLFAERRYDDTWFVATVSADDPHHIGGVRRVATAAEAAGATVRYREFDGGGHGVETVQLGLRDGLEALYARLGLDAGRSPEQAAAEPSDAIPPTSPAGPIVP